jgi:ketosteroid isomerase-like protein
LQRFRFLTFRKRRTHMSTIRNRFAMPLIGTAFALAMVPFTAALAQDAVANEIIALAKSQWAAENAMKPTSEAWTNIADDYTEFNPAFPTRVDGKALAAKFYDAQNQSGDVGMVSEMQNAKVQVYGDTAILSYNYAGMTKSAKGELKPNTAKSTRVYVKQNNRWMLVHANFAPVAAAAD